MGGRWYAPHKSGSTILCAAKADRARRWGGSPHTHSCEAEPAGRVEPSGRGGGGPGKPRAAVRGDMWRGHGGGDGAVLGARSAHCSAEKGLMSGKSGTSSSRTVFGKCAPPAAGGRPCRRSPAPWTGRGGGAAAPQRPLHAGAALCCLVGSMLVLCATFSRLQWRCTASHGEWHAACAAPRLARTAPESALDGPACAARAPHKLTHRLPFSGRRRSISRLSIKTGGLCDAVYAIGLPSFFLCR